MAPVFRFNNLMFRYYETFRYGCCSRFIMCDNEKLSNYLQLSSYQANEVANINEYFLDMQGESLRASEKMRDKKMRQAVYGNLKLMKKVLTPEQYRKYVVLLNVTNNNNRTLNF